MAFQFLVVRKDYKILRGGKSSQNWFL